MDVKHEAKGTPNVERLENGPGVRRIGDPAALKQSNLTRVVGVQIDDALPKSAVQADLTDWAMRVFAAFEQVLPKRYAREEFGDALEQLTKMRATGAPRWHRNLFITKTLFWLLLNVARAALPIVASLLRIFGHG